MGKETNVFTMIRRIGGTSYRMKVVFSPDATETMSEKILRMIRACIGCFRSTPTRPNKMVKRSVCAKCCCSFLTPERYNSIQMLRDYQKKKGIVWIISKSTVLLFAEGFRYNLIQMNTKSLCL
ncbi:transposon-encoded TnpW family protein [Oribacterium sp. HCP28S3_H8]|uniref:transposon-encoded TnpW family protein n=1 Tax=Oribacterium sp. HCP28S3_H8 TaxID=3438945 RepID=UPI003F8BA9EC